METPSKKAGVPRRAVLRAMGAVGATVAGAWPVRHALAQSDPAANYPNKPIRVIIPFVAGGSGDTVIRAVGLRLTAAWGQQVVIENRAGASGALGLQVASKSAPDGYTLVLGTSSTHAINPHLQQDLGYDAFRDFAPVAMLITAPNVMVAHPSVPANNLRELIALAKAQPGKLSFASNGAGTVSHLSGELLNSEAMIKLLHVPYKGAGQAVNDVLGGHVPLLIGALPTTLSHVNAGRLKAIGVTTAQRSPAAPAIPTFAESALPGFDVGQWFGIFAPPTTPRELLTKLNLEINRALNQAELKAEFARVGFDTTPRSPAEFNTYMRAESARWAKVIKEADIRVS
jgi:tripartite-type tricarboxylate transporter receptor subunit TctC